MKYRLSLSLHDIAQVLYREALTIEDWELDEREGGERTAADCDVLQWDQSQSKSAVVSYLSSALKEVPF